MSSRTQVDFRGSSIQARSVDSGRVTSETPITVDARVATYTYLTGATAPVANSYTFTDAGSFIISGTTTGVTGSSFSTIAHVSGASGAYAMATVTASGSTGVISGAITPSLSSGALVLSRSTSNGPDTLSVTVRKL